MTFTFTTESGSVYEVDEAGHRMRRVTGEEPPTPRQGDDGAWKDYAVLSEVEVGKSVMIGWAVMKAENGETVAVKVEATVTSPVSSCDAG
jgi:hypothetical protein